MDMIIYLINDTTGDMLIHPAGMRYVIRLTAAVKLELDS